MSETLAPTAAGDGATSTFRRAVAVPFEGLYLEDADVLVPRPDEVLVRSSIVGICGSDTHALSGTHPFLTSAYVPGHEAVGLVAGVGAEVEGLTVGQRVILKPNVSCGTCVNCLAGRSNACEKLTWIGCDPSRQWSGAMATEFVAPGRNLFPVPDGVDDHTAVLVECLATPVHAARIAGDLDGAHVVVLGAGTIGVLCVVAALHAGATSVVVTDMDEGKLERARRIGAHGAVLASAPDADAQVIRALGNPTADVVLDCVANERSFAQSVALLRRAGSLVVVGVPARDASLPMPLIQDWEIRVQGCAAYTEADVRTAIDIAAAGGLPADEIISQVFELEKVADAFAAATNDSSGKVLIVP
ncbi:alcohol dehydrogenase catalytic domain-containing protein [uncultured Microbacterium sp.]|uniref:zinc-dependent alcohol dehydrogenase n=1 Tax=uncultured Microbacterium sp. TaxID=191216 RepID=UPI0028D6BB75|nr:alcohol dehydrogenase catalytic domain-containing protein [uncultured Microbacterium sp.]